MNDTANAVLIVIKRNNGIIAPSLTENLGAVKGVGVFYATNCLARSDAVCIVGISIAIKALELSAFLPSQRMTR